MSSSVNMFKEHPTLFTDYDSGEIAATADYLEAAVQPGGLLRQMLVYPMVDCKIKLNGSAKEIHLPAEVWTPIGVAAESFNIKTASGTGTVHWQGWYR
ncbi:hypothetical protein [Anaerotalea alkaliphila]|uniref:Uncharacterized protein n=1 Tax=Anaerotalea alkaliphila TaxID=2662126 RepID=A0A7X5KMI0_9FIRM|nr:hypothetical protein [Anaerotalea alkaliphila]NDL68011.1 hypothetical protein [Anaerotalea alkaliphila]